MSNLKELTKVLDYYLKDYAHPVDWPKFRQALREISGVLKALDMPDEEAVGALIGVGLNMAFSENVNRKKLARAKILKLLQEMG